MNSQAARGGYSVYTPNTMATHQMVSCRWMGSGVGV